jgi:pyruvate dehydrogenase E1 component
MYRLPNTHSDAGTPAVRLLGSGAILREVIAAGDLLAQDWKLASEVWSVTSFTELANEARATERSNRLHSQSPRKASYVSQCMAGDAPIVAATDYVAAYAGLVAPFLTAPFTALGTDGFGRSDTRAALRRFFEVDRHHITLCALYSLAQSGAIALDVVAAAVQQYQIDIDLAPPWTR